MHGMCPTGVFNAHYAFSTDARHWRVSPRQTYSYTVALTGGDSHTYTRCERPQLFFEHQFASNGTMEHPLVLYNGVCDGLACLGQPPMTYSIARVLNTN